MTEVLEAMDSSRSGLGRAIRISANEYCTKFIIILLAALFVLTGGLSILAETVYENYWESAQP